MERVTADHRRRPLRARRRLNAGALVGLALLAAACSGSEEPGATKGLQGVAGPDLGLAATLQPFDACDDALRWFQDEALRLVGPYGLGGSTQKFQAVGGAVGNDSTRTSSAPTTVPASPGPAAETGNAAPGHSTTNVQEAGVDEPDIAKTDGRRIVSITGNRLNVTAVDNGAVALRGTLDLPVQGSHQLLLRNDRVLVITTDGYAGVSSSSNGVSRYPGGGSGNTHLTMVDIADDTRPTVRDQTRVDGSYVDARLIGERARIVISSEPRALGFVYPSDGSEAAQSTAKKANEEAIRRSTIDDWIPHVHRGDAARPVVPDGGSPSGTVAPPPPGTADNRLVACEQLRHPKAFSGFGTLAVSSIDLAGTSAEPKDSVGVAADGNTVYASATNLYVATTEPRNDAIPVPMPTQGDAPASGPAERTAGTAAGQPAPPASAVAPTSAAPSVTVVPTPTSPPATATPPSIPPATSAPPVTTVPPATAMPAPPPPPQPRTAIHLFGIAEPGPAQYKASGLVDGAFLNQYSFSEHAGHLRVVTTIGNFGCGRCSGSETKVSVLAERNGELVVVGSVGNLGKNEAVRAVRFIGDLGYVVTFRQTDPLYVIDLRDPANPRVTGELKVPGYSAYLHPVAPGFLLGVGQEATDQGRTLGTKLALYDVRDPANPREVQNLVLPGSRSDVENEAHAFLFWEPTRLAVVPVRQFGTGGTTGEFVGALGITVSTDGIVEKGRITNEPSGFASVQILRSIVVGDSLFTLSETGVRASRLADLQPTGWAAFPLPPSNGANGGPTLPAEPAPVPR